MGRTKQTSDRDLLDAAREEFVAKGFGASTRAIARRAGVSEAVLFQRYRTKVALFFAAMVPPPLAVDELLADRAKDGVEGGLEEAAVEVMRYFRTAMPILIQLVTHPSFSLEMLAKQQTELPLLGLRSTLLRVLEAERTRGAISADDQALETAVLTLVASIHSLALFERMGVHGGTIPDIGVRRMAALLLRGLGASALEKGSVS